jgi:plastocyanin
MKKRFERSKRLGAVAIAVVVSAATTGLLAGTSKGTPTPTKCTFWDCKLFITATGPSPSRLEINPLSHVTFIDADSRPHTVVFANGLCLLTVDPAGAHFRACGDHIPWSFAGTYAYTVDGRFPGAVITTPYRRSVTLTARAHTVGKDAQLTLHGRVRQAGTGSAPPPPVVVLARHTRTQPFEPVARVRTRGSHQATYGWKLNVHPTAETTYVAVVTAQRVCYFPASRCAHPLGQVWVNAKSRAFTVRIRKEGPR